VIEKPQGKTLFRDRLKNIVIFFRVLSRGAVNWTDLILNGIQRGLLWISCTMVLSICFFVSKPDALYKPEFHLVGNLVSGHLVRLCSELARRTAALCYLSSLSDPPRTLTSFTKYAHSSLLFAVCLHLFTFISHKPFSASSSHPSLIFTPFLAYFPYFEN
jgi:hypothetical protein